MPADYSAPAVSGTAIHDEILEIRVSLRQNGLDRLFQERNLVIGGGNDRNFRIGRIILRGHEGNLSRVYFSCHEKDSAARYPAGERIHHERRGPPGGFQFI